MKVGIVAGSIREGRKGIKIAEWLTDLAQQRGDAEFELIDLKEFNVPFLTDPRHPATMNGQYPSPETQAWADAIGSCDALVFVTPEYNHSVPGAFKNAVDSIAAEWRGKPMAITSYGSLGGVRAAEHWRQIMPTFGTWVQGPALDFSVFTDFDADGNFTPAERKTAEANAVLDSLVSATNTLAAAK